MSFPPAAGQVILDLSGMTRHPGMLYRQLALQQLGGQAETLRPNDSAGILGQ